MWYPKIKIILTQNSSLPNIGGHLSGILKDQGFAMREKDENIPLLLIIFFVLY